MCLVGCPEGYFKIGNRKRGEGIGEVEEKKPMKGRLSASAGDLLCRRVISSKPTSSSVRRLHYLSARPRACLEPHRPQTPLPVGEVCSVYFSLTPLRWKDGKGGEEVSSIHDVNSEMDFMPALGCWSYSKQTPYKSLNSLILLMQCPTSEQAGKRLQPSLCLIRLI